MREESVTSWLARSSVRQDPRGSLAVGVVGLVSTVVSSLVLAANAISSEVPVLSAPQATDTDLGPVVLVTLLVVMITVFRVQALVGRAAEHDDAVLSAAGLSPGALIRIARLTTRTGASLGVASAAPIVAVSAWMILPLYVEARPPAPILIAVVAAAWLCSALVVLLTSIGAAVLVATVAAHRLPGRVLRGDDADRAEASRSWGGRAVLVVALWMFFVFPVLGAVLAWDALTAMITVPGVLFDAADAEEFTALEMFTPALRLTGLHSVMLVVTLLSVVLLLPLLGPRFLQFWLRAVPSGRGAAWLIVRARAARSRVTVVSAITLVSLVVGLVAAQQSSMDMAAMLGAVPSDRSVGTWIAMTLAVGPPSAVALAGASAATLLSRPSGDPEARILKAHGATPSLAPLLMLTEAIVVVATATVPAVAAVALSTLSTLTIALVSGDPVVPRLPNPMPVVVVMVIAVVALATGAALARASVVSATRTRSATAPATARPWRR